MCKNNHHAPLEAGHGLFSPGALPVNAAFPTAPGASLSPPYRSRDACGFVMRNRGPGPSTCRLLPAEEEARHRGILTLRSSSRGSGRARAGPAAGTAALPQALGCAAAPWPGAHPRHPAQPFSSEESRLLCAAVRRVWIAQSFILPSNTCMVVVLHSKSSIIMMVQGFHIARDSHLL